MILEVKEKLKEIVMKNVDMKISFKDISDETNLIKEFILDSLQIVNIIADIELVFEVAFPQDRKTLELLTKFDELSNFIQKMIMKDKVN